MSQLEVLVYGALLCIIRMDRIWPIVSWVSCTGCTVLSERDSNWDESGHYIAYHLVYCYKGIELLIDNTWEHQCFIDLSFCSMRRMGHFIVHANNHGQM